MNISELEALINCKANITKLYQETLTLYTHVGSMGQTSAELVVVVTTHTLTLEGFKEEEVFRGTPDCVGSLACSNYAHEKDVTKDSTPSIYDWAKEAWPGLLLIHLQLNKVRDWEGCACEEVFISATFHNRQLIDADYMEKVTHQSSVHTVEAHLGEVCTYKSFSEDV